MNFHHLTKVAAATIIAAASASSALAQSAPKLKVGLMLPATGTFAALGTAIENGFRLHLAEQGGKFGGREVEFFKVDDESDPSKATDNVNKLIKRDNVDVLVGTVHSGVAMAMAKVAKDTGTVLIVPNAGADAVTGAMCAPNIFRSSFSNWQPGYATGVVAAEKGYKRAMTITWNYAAGSETVKGFTEAFEKGGGKVMKDLSLPFPNVEFQALLTEIAAQKPDVVFAFFAPLSAATLPIANAGCQFENELRTIFAPHIGPVIASAPALGMMSSVFESFAAFAIASATPECTVPTSTSTLSRLISLPTLSVALDGSDSSSTLKYWTSRPASLPPCSCT